MEFARLGPRVEDTEMSPGMVVHVCNLSYSGGGGRKSTVPGWPRQKCETLSERQKQKAGSMAEVVQGLLSKCAALISIPATAEN
jgi:hypothetical protein